jgi:hypothetical protein
MGKILNRTEVTSGFAPHKITKNSGSDMPSMGKTGSWNHRGAALISEGQINNINILSNIQFFFS